MGFIEKLSIVGRNDREKMIFAVLSRIGIAICATIATKVLLGAIVFTAIRALGRVISDSADVDYLFKWLANDVVSYAFSFIFFIVLTYRLDKSLKTDYSFRKWETVPYFFMLTAAGSIGVYATKLISYALENWFGVGALIDPLASLVPENVFQAVTYLVVTALIGPICEELLYRYYILRPLRLLGDTAAVIISALVFSGFHGSAYQFLHITFTGLALGLLAVRSNSIIPPIILHCVNNFIVAFYNCIPVFDPDGSNPVLSTIKNYLSPVLLGCAFVGAALFFIFLGLGRIRLKSNSGGVTGRRCAALVVMNPFIIGAALFLIVLFLG